MYQSVAAAISSLGFSFFQQRKSLPATKRVFNRTVERDEFVKCQQGSKWSYKLTDLALDFSRWEFLFFNKGSLSDKACVKPNSSTSRICQLSTEV